MTMLRELRFHSDGEGRLSLPPRCSLDVSCFEEPEVQEAVAIVLEEALYIAAYAGIELKALDGITVALDCQAAATTLQNLPEGQVPLEMSPQPESMEMARTAAVRREGDLRFHIVIRTGLSLMALSPDPELQRLSLPTPPANSSAGNSNFEAKKPRLLDALLRMNLDIAKEKEWGENQIRERAKVLADQAVKIWPAPPTTIALQI
jgi:hypothetical protein